MSFWTSWRLALRLARRDLFKNKARAIIALAMVTLPVLTVVAADVLIQTAQVSSAEGIDRRIGTTATAELRLGQSGMPVTQGADPMKSGGESGEKLSHPTRLADIEAVIGRRTTTPAPARKDLLLATTHGREYATGTELDVKARLAAGLFRLVSGRWPTSPGEVVVNRPTLDRIASHSTLTTVGRDRAESTHAIVGTVVDATSRTMPVVLGLPGAFPEAAAYSSWEAGGQGWLVDGPPITWDQVQQLNRLGVFVTDRTIATHPGDYPDPFPSSGVDDTTIQVAALIVVMALIEVVLLAGPAFAVGARKQQRSLALLVSSGGTPAQARRVIIGGGLLLGLSAGVLGMGGGILAGWLLMPVAQRFNGEWLGPFEIDWLHVLAVAAFGLVSALIACVVPAWIASRQNVVAVLAGRRGDAKPVRAFPWIGLALFAVGVLVACGGARPAGGGELTIAWAAVICVLGMVLLVPVVVSWMARLAGRLPLPVRFAARDAVRHRTRTTPAVAAVAATVAGVVALGISTASDEKQNRETYLPSMVMGNASVTPSYDFVDDSATTTDWRRIADTVAQGVPDARISAVTGLAQTTADGNYLQVSFTAPHSDTWLMPYQTRSGLGTEAIVSDGTDLSPTVRASLPAGDEVQAALASGKAVVFGDHVPDLHEVQIKSELDSADGEATKKHRVTVPALVVDRGDEPAPAVAILPPSIAKQVGIPITTVALEVDRPELTTGEEKDLNAALAALPAPASLMVERGYQPDAYTKIVQWVLALLGGILMLGGTLTAMFLALTDARPDLATLAAVGAEARVRRKVAASYTFVMAFVGAVLGMLVGFVPGIAITRPLTRTSAGDGGGPMSYFLDIPWLMIAVVVIGLPILASVLVGLCVRSRLPMVSRLS